MQAESDAEGAIGMKVIATESFLSAAGLTVIRQY
jgi:hypothetical protein